MDNESQNTKKKKKTMYIGIAAMLAGILCIITGIVLTIKSSVMYIPVMGIGLIVLVIGKALVTYSTSSFAFQKK